MRSTLIQSILTVLAIGQAGWSATNVAKANTITITEIGTVDVDDIQAAPGVSLNLVGQPFTLTTTFDPTSATPLAGCATTVCDQLSGSSVFTAPDYSLQLSPNPPNAVTLMWGFSTPGGSPTLQLNDRFAGGATINGVPQEANGFSVTSSVTGSTSIPNPLSLNGTFSTPASSGSLTISGGASVDALVDNLTITGAPTPSIITNQYASPCINPSSACAGGGTTITQAGNVSTGSAPLTIGTGGGPAR